MTASANGIGMRYPLIGGEYSMCKQVFKLFSKVGIPREEQIILWNMAIKETGCLELKKKLRLLYLQQKNPKKQMEYEQTFL